MTPIAASAPRSWEGSSETFFAEWSRYIDGFMANRSILRSVLFPDKPEQMWFGYLYTRTVIEPLTEWLEARLAPAELGARLQAPLAPAHAVNVVGAMWNYLFASLGLVLEGRELDVATARGVLAYWHRVHAAYTTRWDPASPVPPLSGPFQYRIVAPAQAERLAGLLDPAVRAGVQPLIAALANYSWLMEAESRQGTFSHGLYALADGSQLLVRCFGDLAGSTYPWLEEFDASIPAGPVALLLGLRDVEASFDLLGVVHVTPEHYAERVTGVGLLTQDGPITDCADWLVDLGTAVAKAHRHLYRIVMPWSREDRFVAGARSYARLWIPFVRLGGGTQDDVQRLVLDPLDAAVRDILPACAAAEGPPAIWTWAARTDRPTVLSPLLEALDLRQEDDR